MAQHTVKNVVDGIRYINTKGGPIGLAPGETAEKLEIDAAELKIARDTGWFEIDGKADDTEAPIVEHPGIGEGEANNAINEPEKKPAKR